MSLSSILMNDDPAELTATIHNLNLALKSEAEVAARLTKRNDELAAEADRLRVTIAKLDRLLCDTQTESANRIEEHAREMNAIWQTSKRQQDRIDDLMSDAEALRNALHSATSKLAECDAAGNETQPRHFATPQQASETNQCQATEQMEVLPGGGRQSQSPFDFTTLPPTAILAVVQVLTEGARTHGKENWRNIPADTNVARAMAHLFQYQQTPADWHQQLSHALCRIIFAFEVEVQGQCQQNPKSRRS